MKAAADLVIRGGDIADGSGGPLRTADLAIRDGRIVEIGRVTLRGHQEIDAAGCLVTPGFVDIHTHYDGQALWDTRLAPSSWHGVTTAVMGNCGVGFAPVRAHDHDRLIELMEGVEDIPGVALQEGLDWNWESFADYLDALERGKRDIDVAAQLPHGALRLYVMGERASRLEAATDIDIAHMRQLSADAMRAGALGFSTSRSLNHRTARGDPTPSLRATRDELMGIALGLRDAGRGVLQFISDFDTPSLEAEFSMLRDLCAASGRPMSISVAQRHTVPQVWRQLLDHIADAVGQGLSMRAQVAPRPIGVLYGLQGSRNPFSACPSFAALAALPLAAKVASLREPALRERLIAEAGQPQVDPQAQRLTAFDRIFPFGDPPDYAPPAASSIASQARSRGLPPAALALELLLKDDGRAFLFAPFANYADCNLDVCRDMLADPNTVPGLGDGGAHVSIISDASFPTYLLAHWGREGLQNKFDLGWLVKRQTADTARAVGLLDRGTLECGQKADINVIDLDKLALQPPVMHPDLPAGGNRLLQRASGYVATIVSGTPAYLNGQPTGQLAGRLVRGPQPDGRLHA
ncbi:MAG: D-aminoacylase [Variovorax sp.]|nr:MAG: D-aminoacylase [Variovorax sp.]